MTLQAQLQQELTNLGSGGGATMYLAEGSRELVCELVERNPLAVSLGALRLTTSELAEATVDRLERISKSLAERLTYLMEPISPIETDADACTVQMRSSPPQKDDDCRSYYELLVRRGGEIALMRYRKENRAARRPVPATLTREVLLRLVDDFCAVLD